MGFLLLSLGFSQTSTSVQPHSNNILVLIQPALAGPDVDPLNYWQPQWILWPRVVRESDGGRLLSVATGDNWVGNPADFQFDPVKHGSGWVSRNFSQMNSRGIFMVRRAALGSIRTDLLVGASGSASPNALRLALNEDSPNVIPYRVDAVRWPTGSLMVAEASGWDEVLGFVRATSGRVLVVEYPPRQDVLWTRYWLRGQGWTIDGQKLRLSADDGVIPSQVGLPVPGLIRARNLIPLITHPARFAADFVTLREWPGANRFFELYRSKGLIVGTIWMLFVLAMVAWGVVLISNERSANVAPVLLAALLLSPAILNLSGQLGRWLSLDAWPIWTGLGAVFLVMASYGIAFFQRRLSSRIHPLFGVFAVGLAVMCLFNPIWSFMSPLFGGRSSMVSPIAMGALFGYLIGVVLSIRGCGPWFTWTGRLVCLLFLVVGIALHRWWIEDLGASLFMPVAALLVGEGFFRWSMLLGIAVWPFSLIPLYVRGFIWAPLGLLRDGRDTAGINLAGYVDFVSSPSLGVFILMAGGTAIFGYRFFFHQMRKLGKIDTRRNALPCAAIAAATFGLLHPPFLSASLVVGVGATAALLFDGIQTM